MNETHVKMRATTNPRTNWAVSQTKSKSWKNAIFPYLSILPAMLFFIFFSYYPFIKTILISTTITDAAGQFKKFVGFDNFIYLVTRDDFSKIILNTIKFVPAVALSSIVMGLCLALYADEKIERYSRIYEMLFSMPMAIASASAAIVWSMIFNPSIGALNHIFSTNISWLTDPNWAFFSVTLVTVWLQMAVNFIFLLTGLRAVPQELKEAAMIDGATGIKKFIKVTLPMISPTLFFVIFFNAMASFQAFGQIRLLTQGGPGLTTRVLVYDIYLEAFMNFRFGTACAESILLFLVMLAFTLIQFKFENKGVHYS